MEQTNQSFKKFLSSEDIDFVIEIIKKYNLGPTKLINDPELKRILCEAKTDKERVEIIKNLPFNKLLDILEGIIQGKFQLENLSNLIKENLNLPSVVAEKIAKELSESIFELPKRERQEISHESYIRSKEPRKDIYREPIE